LTEQVSTERFDDFKEQIIDRFNDRFNDLKGAIDILSSKIDTYNNMSHNQSKDIEVLKTKTEELEKLKTKVETQEKEIVRIDTERKSSQKFVLLLISIMGLLIALISNWDKIFK
jgi:DNA repair exonuclease SbcCD ATPase subunit